MDKMYATNVMSSVLFLLWQTVTMLSKRVRLITSACT